ncbi:MAG: NADH-quinone oxidoreductase subunit F, partial [Calditrichaeota bacterium]|nr:NADH-quinone oxidoreductase subunit F [Calditrichota bacterium]MCB0312626.1 NADH-quinone oxidoreductase subunit F [Calditrichota bacterium]
MYEKVLTKDINMPESRKLAYYEKVGGYRSWKKALKEMDPDAVIELVKASKLRGRGGAGFPTGVKWGFVPKSTDKPHYMLVNADESEPGTFKDRLLMAGMPHSTIEGAAIGSYAIRANTCYIYIRGEFV